MSALLAIPLLRPSGGLLLLWIAVRLVRPGEDGRGTCGTGTSLRQAVWIIVVADVTMSLDNVLAVAAAAHGDILLVVLGIALSLPIVVWGSGFLARLMARHAVDHLDRRRRAGLRGRRDDDRRSPGARLARGPRRHRRRSPVAARSRSALALLGWWLARGAASGPTARGGA